MFLLEFIQDNLIPVIVISSIILILFIVLIYLLIRKKRRVVNAKIDISNYIDALGGITNIKGASFIQSRLQLQVNDTKLVDSEKLKSLGASGVVKTSKKVSVVIGKLSEILSKEINELINNKKV